MLRILVITLLLVGGCVSVASQQARLLPLGINESSLIDQILTAKATNPKIADVDLARSANELFQLNGMAFRIYLDADTCSKIREVKQKQKDPNAPVKLGVQLQSIGADRAPLTLPQPVLTSAECGDCYIALPILEFTSADFITKIMGHNIKFQRPANFNAEKIYLLDNTDTSKLVKSWNVPFRGVPIGVSHDTAVLYLGFADPQLSMLAIAVFDSGEFEITTRAEAEDGGLGVADKSTTNEPRRKVIRFDRWKEKYLVSYLPPC